MVKRKGMHLGDLAPVAIAFVVGFVTLAFGVSIITSIGNGLPFNSAAYNVTTNATLGSLNISSYAPVLGTVLAGAIVIGILMHAFVKGGEP